MGQNIAALQTIQAVLCAVKMVKIFEEIDDLNELKRESRINYGLSFISFVLFVLLGYFLDKIWYIVALIISSYFVAQRRYFDTKYYITKNFIELEKALKNGKA
jgi:hypothetical protein|tara:strand:+ start:1329 stop:1637 length:309 start_codon:yes stop_codon:yes gene_type:complete